MQDYDYTQEAEKLISNTIGILSKREKNILLEEDDLIQKAYKFKHADKVDTLSGIDNDYINTLKPTANLSNKNTKLPYKYTDIPDPESVSFMDRLIENLGLIFLVKDNETNAISIATPGFSFNFNGTKSSPMKAPLKVLFGLGIIPKCTSKKPWQEFKKEAKIFKFDPSIHDEFDKPVITSGEPLFLTVQEFLDECKNKRDKDCYDIVCVNIENISFTMPGRIIFKLEELESGLINKNPKFANIIPQELKDALPGFTEISIQEKFINKLASLYIKNYIGMRLLEIALKVGEYYNVEMSEINKIYFNKYPTSNICVDETQFIKNDQKIMYSASNFSKNYVGFVLETAK